MIKVKQKKLADNMVYMFECAHCDATIKFCYQQPIICPYCRELLYDAKAMIEDEEERILYHVVGKV